MKIHMVLQTEQQLRHNIRKQVYFLKKTMNCMGPLNDVNKLQADNKNNKNRKKLKSP